LPTSSGTNYLKIQAFPLGVSGSYTLNYSHYSADAWDPSDDTGTNGTLLTLGEAAKIHEPHVLDQYDEFDWFAVNLSSGVVYRFESTGDADVYGELYSDVNASFEWDDDDSGEGFNFQLDYNVPASGTYYLRVGKFQSVANYDLLYYIPANDFDADQLLDSWEIQYFGDLTATPNGQSDSDSYSDFEEYIAGTDPTNAASFFTMTSWETGSFVVQWPSVESREYKVLWAENLTNSFQQLGPMINHPQNSYTDTTHNAEASGFYKVEVQLK
jgi:hypothetical protein